MSLRMSFLIQSFLIIGLNLSSIFASYEELLTFDNDAEKINEVPCSQSISSEYFISSLHKGESIIDQQRKALSYVQKFFCKTAATVTAGIILYGLYNLSFVTKEEL